MGKITLSNCSSNCFGDSNCGYCGGCGKGLCIAHSKCGCVLFDPLCNNNSTDTKSAIVNIPGGSCITKIYASMPNAPSSAKFMLVRVYASGVDPEDTKSKPIFCHAIYNNAKLGALFDTSLIQPLCVENDGNKDAIIKVTAYKDKSTGGGLEPADEMLTLTVVYCENCC